MRTLLNLIVVLAATGGTGLAQTRGNSAACRPCTGCCPAPLVFQNRFNPVGPGYPGSFTARPKPESQARPGQRANLARAAGFNSTLRADTSVRPKGTVPETRAELREAEKQQRLALIHQRNAARARPALLVDIVSPVSASDGIAWPELLKGENFAGYRVRVSQVLEYKKLTGRMAVADAQQIKQMTGTILEELEADVQDIRPQDYVAVKTFARALLLELRR